MPPMVDEHASPGEGLDGVEHGLCRRAGSEGVDGDVDALAVGLPANPVGQVRRAGGQHLDAVGRESLDVGEQVRVTAGAENAGDARPSAMRQAPRPRVPEMPSIRTARPGPAPGASRGACGCRVAVSPRQFSDDRAARRNL
jgi:hypothetical protein